MAQVRLLLRMHREWIALLRVASGAYGIVRSMGAIVRNTNRLHLSDLSGHRLVRFEMADGCSYNVHDDDAAHTIGHSETKFRAIPGDVTGDVLVAYLYRVSGIDPHRFVFDLPSSMGGTGSTRSGAGGSTRGNRTQEGFIWLRGADGKPNMSTRPVGKVIFASPNERMRDDDPTARTDFERFG